MSKDKNAKEHSFMRSFGGEDGYEERDKEFEDGKQQIIDRVGSSKARWMISIMQSDGGMEMFVICKPDSAQENGMIHIEMHKALVRGLSHIEESMAEVLKIYGENNDAKGSIGEPDADETIN